MSGLKPVSHSIKNISGKTFEKKFVALGRVLENWTEIIGGELAAQATPSRIKMQKKKGDYLRTLVVDAPPALTTVLHYKKGLILERMARILGPDYIYDVVFEAGEVRKETQSSTTSINEILTESEEATLEEFLANIEDEDLKSRLRSLGKSVLKTEENKG